MDYSDAENGSDGELDDDILGAEDLFSDEAEESEKDDDSQSTHRKSEEKVETDKKASKKEKVEKKPRQTRVVKNPRVTLNFDSLQGKNGLSALKKLFKNFKFKGNGHEVEDLTAVMRILQQWMCYQLCPAYDFESCMLQLEALGKKKAVQTLMKKYRMEIDEWGENKSDGEGSSVTDKAMEVNENIDRADDFDLLLDAEIANADSDTEINENDAPPAQSTQKEPEFVLTQEQLERIARNKKLAEERRQKRMSAPLGQTEINEVPEVSVEKDVLDGNS